MEKICFECSKSFKVGKDTVHCLNCDRWCCTDQHCWFDFNEDYVLFLLYDRIGKNKEYESTWCENCED